MRGPICSRKCGNNPMDISTPIFKKIGPPMGLFYAESGSQIDSESEPMKPVNRCSPFRFGTLSGTESVKKKVIFDSDSATESELMKSVSRL